MIPEDKQRLSDWLDGHLTKEEQQEVARRVSADPDWAKTVSELKLLKAWASEPGPDLPGGAVTRLQNRLFKQRRKPARIVIGSLMAAAAILAFSIWSRPQESNVDPLLAEIRQAQLAYAGAIERLQELAGSRLETLPPELTATYRENLLLIDRAILQCESLTRGVPDQSEPYWALTRAYQAKIDLLEQILKS